MYPSHFVHSSGSGHRGCFYLLAIENNIATNLGCTTMFEFVFISFGCIIPRSGIPESHDNCRFTSFEKFLFKFQVVSRQCNIDFRCVV